MGGGQYSTQSRQWFRHEISKVTFYRFISGGRSKWRGVAEEPASNPRGSMRREDQSESSVARTRNTHDLFLDPLITWSYTSFDGRDLSGMELEHSWISFCRWDRIWFVSGLGSGNGSLVDVEGSDVVLRTDFSFVIWILRDFSLLYFLLLDAEALCFWGYVFHEVKTLYDEIRIYIMFMM